MERIRQLKGIKNGWYDFKTQKMPGDSFNISAFGCVTGQKLAKIKGSVCYDCYATKGAYPWPVVQNAMQARLDFLNSANFVVDMVQFEQITQRHNALVRFRRRARGTLPQDYCSVQLTPNKNHG